VERFSDFLALQAALLGEEGHGAHQFLDADDADEGLKKKVHY
jgi:hypothetical protein